MSEGPISSRATRSSGLHDGSESTGIIPPFPPMAEVKARAEREERLALRNQIKSEKHLDK